MGKQTLNGSPAASTENDRWPENGHGSCPVWVKTKLRAHILVGKQSKQASLPVGPASRGSKAQTDDRAPESMGLVIGVYTKKTRYIYPI